MARLPKTRCCQSTPRCARCPVRLMLEAKAMEQRSAREQLFHEIFRGRARALPEPVAAQLEALAAARAR